MGKSPEPTTEHLCLPLLLHIDLSANQLKMKKNAAAMLALGALGPALAQDIDRDDVPRQCESVCANIVLVSDECDRRFSRDRDELACMCQADNAQEVVPLCAACIEFYNSDDEDDRDDEDNDAGEIRRDCNFASTTYDPSSTYSVPQMTAATNLSSGGSNNPTPNPTPTSNQGPLSSALDSISSDLATATTTNQASLSSVVNSVSSDLASQPTPAADSAGNSAATNNDGSHAALAGAALLAAAAWL